MKPSQRLLPLAHPFRLIVVGRSNSGKTTLLLNLFLNPMFYYQFFHKIFLFSPSGHADPKWKLLGIPREQIFTKVSHTEIYKIMLMQKTAKREAKKKNLEEPKFAIIFDDTGADKEMRGHLYANPVDFLNFNCRWVNTSLFFSAQNLNSFSIPCKTNPDGIIAFNPNTKYQKKLLYDNYGMEDFRHFSMLLRRVYTQPRDFLFIHQQGPVITYFKNFSTKLGLTVKTEEKKTKGLKREHEESKGAPIKRVKYESTV